MILKISRWAVEQMDLANLMPERFDVVVHSSREIFVAQIGSLITAAVKLSNREGLIT